MESFIKEYTSLKEELARMREACESLRNSNLKGDLRELKNSIFEISSGSKTTPHRRAEPEMLRPILKDRSYKRSEGVYPDAFHHVNESSRSLVKSQTVRPYQYDTLDSYQNRQSRRGKF